MPWSEWRLAWLLPLFSLLITLSLATMLLLSWVSKIPESFWLPLLVTLRATVIFLSVVDAARETLSAGWHSGAPIIPGEMAGFESANV
jgi:hypothetical protein